MWRLTVICLLVIPACLGQLDDTLVQVNIDLSASRLHPGEDVNMVCRVNNIPETGYIYWFKTIMGTSGELVDLIASSSQPLPPYDLYTRFSFSEVNSGSTRIYTLKITNVTEEDNGHFGCSYRELDGNVFESEPFEVYSPVDEITIMADYKKVTDKDGIKTDEDTPTYMEITVNSSMPTPAVMVYVDDYDITKEFSYHSYSELLCTETGSSKTCPLHHLKATKVFGNYTFDGMLDETMLTVVTVVPGSGFDQVNRSVPLTVEHSPNFKCAKEQYARQGANYTMSCDIHARPTADVFYWVLKADGEITYAMPNKFVKEWNAYAAVKEVDEQEAVVSLTLYDVNPARYTDYELVVGNNYGNNSLIFTLMEDFSPPVGPSSASYLTSNIIILLAAMIMSLWGHYD